MAAANTRATALGRRPIPQRPEIEARLVRLYKLGNAGYWRLLLDVDDAQSIGRAYRTAAALTQLDTQRVREHEGTLKSLSSRANGARGAGAQDGGTAGPGCRGAGGERSGGRGPERRS